MQITFTLRVAPVNPEFGQGFIGRVFDVAQNVSIRAPEYFPDYESARNWTMAKAHDLMAGRPYRRASIKASKVSQNQFYRANIWA